ncbi:MAG TPA: hypothetical protein VFZ66_03530 [Herpetosiphonaceae bacterium]
MESSYVGVTVADPTVELEWVRLIARAQFRPSVLAVDQELPRTVAVAALVVVLDLHHPPVPYGFWLGRVAQPVVLITPHIVAAQTLCPSVPRLAAIVDPVLALRYVGDVLKMVPRMTAGTLVLPDVSAPVQRWHWHGGAA